MNLPNKLTISRIIMSIFIIILLLVPFQMAGIEFPQLFIDEKLVVDSKYLIAGVLFILASITDFLDGFIARKKNLIEGAANTKEIKIWALPNGDESKHILEKCGFKYFGTVEGTKSSWYVFNICR